MEAIEVIALVLGGVAGLIVGLRLFTSRPRPQAARSAHPSFRRATIDVDSVFTPLDEAPLRAVEIPATTRGVTESPPCWICGRPKDEGAHDHGGS